MSDMKVHNIKDILKVLPHRYPILLVDRVTEIAADGSGGKGYKMVSVNEPFFQGHFPGDPVMPGVLIIEGMAQCSGYIALKVLEAKGEIDPTQPKLIYFMMINNVKFRKMVTPGDKLDYDIKILKLSSRLAKFQGYAYVDGELACEAEMTAMWASKEQ